MAAHRRYQLECTADSFRPRAAADPRLTICAAGPADVDRCARLWRTVGAGFWTERCRWTRRRWSEHLARPDVSFHIAALDGTDAGCFELTRMRRGVKIEGFGLLPEQRGQGLGRELLSAATRRALGGGAAKVWLHTATDDHPHALPNYLSGGYRIVRERPLRRPLTAR